MRDSKLYTHFFEELKENKPHIRIDPQNLKILLLLNYLILLAALFIILITPPVSDYEFSIYEAYPNYFWCLIVSTIILGYLCTILATLHDETSRYWPLGFLAAVLANCLVLHLPIIRGYFIYGSGDVLSHIGYIRDIENCASIGSDHYPILHILGFSVHDIVGIDLGITTMIIPPLFSIISIVYWYILGKEVFESKIGAVFLAMLGSLPILGTSQSLFAPNNQANLFIPLILYILIKSQKIPNRRKMSGILIILSVVIVLFHPLVAVMIMSIYALLYVSDKLLIMVSPSKYRTGNAWITVVIMAIVFSLWSTYIYLLTKVLDPLVSSITGSDIVESEIANKFDLVTRVDVDIVYLIKLGLFTYGIDAILGLLSFICILYQFITYSRREITINRSLFFFVVCFIVFFALGGTIFFTLNEFGYVRVHRVARIFSLLIISGTLLLIYTRLKNTGNSKVISFCTFFCTLVIMISILSIFTLHVSPITKLPNQQVPASSYYGMSTFFADRDDSLAILEYGTSQLRYHNSIYGISSQKKNILHSTKGNVAPLDHFGYDHSYYLGSNYIHEKYLLLTPQGKYFYDNIFPEFPEKWRFVEQDFERLESDLSVNCIYSNANLEVYVIIPLTV